MMARELDIHCKALKSRLFNRRGEKLSILMTDFGVHFEGELDRCCKEHDADAKFTADVRALKERCQMFLMNLIEETEKRLPTKKGIFQGMSGLCPKKVLSHVERYPFSQLPFPHLLAENVSDIEEQYRKICLHMWREEKNFEHEIPSDPQTFWAAIYKYENATGKCPYKELALYALTCFSCPVSNADVERIFSIVTCVKTKYRNQMSTKVLDSIVRIRSHLMMQGICCTKFDITSDMLKRFTSEMYDV